MMRADVVFIGDVADYFGVPTSTLHYWERRGLIQPNRRSGWRCYDADALYRISLIVLCRELGLMRLDEIASMLADPGGDGEWRGRVRARIVELAEQRERLDRARDYLDNLLDCPSRDAPERCPGFREHVAAEARRRERPNPVAGLLREEGAAARP